MAEYLLFPVEIISFCILAFALFKGKAKYPNILFPPYGTNVFLSPSMEDMKEVKDGKKKSMQLAQIKMLKAEASHFNSAPFSNEMEITMLFTLLLIGQWTVIEVIKGVSIFFDIKWQDSSMLFYFGLIIMVTLISNLIKVSQLGVKDEKENTMFIVVSLLCALMIVVLFLGLKDLLTLNMKHEFERQSVHLQIILKDVLPPKMWHFMMYCGELFILILGLAIGMLMQYSLPVIIRFGNSFLELKENSTQQLKKKERKYFYILATQLILQIVFVLLYIQPLNLNYAQLKVIILFSIIALQAYTYTTELELHMLKGYDWLSVLYEQPELQTQIITRVQALLKGMVAVAYQLLSKLLIPGILLLLLLIKQPDYDTTMAAIYEKQDMLCLRPVQETMNLLFEDPTQEQSLDPTKLMMNKIQRYGFITRSLTCALIEFLLLSYQLLNVVLTIFYIFFLTKTKAVKQKLKK